MFLCLRYTFLECSVIKTSKNSANALQTETTAPELWSFVDVFIGSGQHGHTYPGATTPWGMVQATPWVHSRYLEPGPWDTQSGYHAGTPRPRFFGMAHTALSGAGTGELGELRLLPAAFGAHVTTENIGLYSQYPAEGRYPVLELDQDLTEASPGFFGTTVTSMHPETGVASGVQIETSATPHGAIHRFLFSSTAEPKISVLLSQTPGAYYGYKLREYWHQLVSDKRFEGCSESFVEGFGGSFSLLCFVIEFDQPFHTPMQSEDRKASPDVTFEFSQGGGNHSSLVIARLSVSRTNIEHARSAFVEEVEGRSLDDVWLAARRSWNAALGVIQVDIEPPERKKMFYSALYHTLLSPNLLSDSDGSYRIQGRSASHLYRNSGSPALEFREVEKRMPLQRAKGRSQYGTFSLWDTYRSLHPLLNLVHPEKSREFGQSLLSFADEWGFLPGFELLASPSDMMGGDGGSIVLSTMAMQGLVNKKQAFAVLNQTRRVPLDERKYLNRKKEILNDVPQSVSRMLEQGMADSCVSRVAGSLNLKDEEAYFRDRAQLARQYWDSDNQVYSPLATGEKHQFLEQSDVDQETDAYAEGTPLQYSWGAQYDAQWQVQKRGGVKEYVCALDYFFEDAPDPSESDQNVGGNIHGASLGNEPSMHTPYLYSLVGHPSRTQDVVDEAVKTLFSAKTDGLPGNDDMGQMSSWLVFSILGFYPVDTCSNDFVLGRPFVTNARMSLHDGRVLQIIVHNQAEENKYVKHAQWQQQALDLSRPILSFDELSQGGLLEFWMGNRSNDSVFKCDTQTSSMQGLWRETKRFFGTFWSSLGHFFGSSTEV